MTLPVLVVDPGKPILDVGLRYVLMERKTIKTAKRSKASLINKKRSI